MTVKRIPSPRKNQHLEKTDGVKKDESYGLLMTKGRIADALRYVKSKKRDSLPESTATPQPRSRKQRIQLKHTKRVRRYIDNARLSLKEKLSLKDDNHE